MTENDPVKIGGLLLAAGGSTRLGRPKQLIGFQGKTLIRRAAETLLESACDPVVIVLGASAKHLLAEINDLSVTICTNHEWEDGMSSSIKTGLAELLEIDSKLDAAVITLCDQPFVTSTDIDSLITEYRSGCQAIVASVYNGTVGVPALFSKDHFVKLASLTGDQGARKIIRDHPGDVRTIAIEHAAYDIDTDADLAQIMDR